MGPFLATGKSDVFSLFRRHGQFASQAGDGGYQLFHDRASLVEFVAAAYASGVSTSA